ncbi:hypothetical protein POU29_20780 [Escherichia coli]
MSDRVIECASRAGRDFSEFMKGEKGMMEALASVDEFGEQLRLNGCVNHHFVSYMMRNSIMQAFMDMAKAERKEECHERCNSDPHPTPEIRSRG